ncbi:hypothetical protein QYB63_002936 [Clostridium perfringens]|nr:hypothetical protein [Clostridium perfringens]
MKEITINVDAYNENSIKTIEGDNLSEVYKIYILKNKRRIDLTNKIAIMAYVDEYGSKRSNILNLNITNASEGEIELAITNIISERNGIYACQIAIYGENNSLEQTAPFNLVVENNIFSKISNTAINSSDFHILSEAIKTTSEYAEKLKQGTEKIELQYANNLNNKMNKDDVLSMANMGQDVKEAMTGGSVAVVGEDAVLEKNIVDKQVTPRKTSFLEVDFWNLAINAETIEQWYIDSSTGAGRKLVSFFTVVLDVKENTNYKYEHTSNKTSNLGTNMRARSVAFYDSEDRYISGSSYPELTISTPENCTKMRMCFVYINQNAEEKGEYYITLRESDKKDYRYIENLKVKSENIENTENLKLKSKNIVDLDLKLNNYKFSTNNIEIRKPSFSFVFDDGNTTDINLKELFNEYGFKCGFALLGNENLNNIKDRYLQMQNEGFEVLSHSIDGKAMQDGTETVEVIENKFKTSKEVLEKNGFIIKGWVTPSTWLNNKYFNSLKKYYCYGLGHLDTNDTNVIHTIKSKDIRQLDRWSLQSNTVEKTKAKIDECISQNAFLCFYAHTFPSSDNFTESNLREILNYLKEKVDLGEIIVDTPYLSINNYYKVRQYDLL